MLDLKQLLSYIYTGAFLLACVGPPKGTLDDRLLNYLEGYSRSIHDYESIFVLMEYGDVNTNQEFALFLEDYIHQENSLMIIIAEGRRVDIAAFASEEHLLFDFENNLADAYVVNNSCVILLEQGKVDTLVKIKKHSLQNTLKYLEGNL